MAPASNVNRLGRVGRVMRRRDGRHDRSGCFPPEIVMNVRELSKIDISGCPCRAGTRSAHSGALLDCRTTPSVYKT